MRDPQTLTHPLARLSGQLFDNGYVLPVAERLNSTDGGWTATTLATALGVQGPNKLRAALTRLETAGLIKVAPGAGPGKVLQIVEGTHPFWNFVSSLTA